VLTNRGPLRKATLRLMHYYADRGSNAMSYTDTTDGAGKFVLEESFRPLHTFRGTHRFPVAKLRRARRHNRSPGLVLTLAAGQIVKDLNFKLIPQAVITGRVTDATGDPMPHVGVNVDADVSHTRTAPAFTRRRRPDRRPRQFPHCQPFTGTLLCLGR